MFPKLKYDGNENYYYINDLRKTTNVSGITQRVPIGDFLCICSGLTFGQSLTVHKFEELERVGTNSVVKSL